MTLRSLPTDTDMDEILNGLIEQRDSYAQRRGVFPLAFQYATGLSTSKVLTLKKGQIQDVLCGKQIEFSKGPVLVTARLPGRALKFIKRYEPLFVSVVGAKNSFSYAFCREEPGFEGYHLSLEVFERDLSIKLGYACKGLRKEHVKLRPIKHAMENG